MARMPGHPSQEFSDEHSTNTLSWIFVERVTRIELALSAWELCGPGGLSPGDSVTCGDLDGLSASDRGHPRGVSPIGHVPGTAAVPPADSTRVRRVGRAWHGSG